MLSTINSSTENAEGYLQIRINKNDKQYTSWIYLIIIENYQKKCSHEIQGLAVPNCGLVECKSSQHPE